MIACTHFSDIQNIVKIYLGKAKCCGCQRDKARNRFILTELKNIVEIFSYLGMFLPLARISSFFCLINSHSYLEVQVKNTSFYSLSLLFFSEKNKISI